MMDYYKPGAKYDVAKPADIMQFTDALKVPGTYWAILSEPLFVNMTLV